MSLTFPNMSDVLPDWFYPMTIGVVAKTTPNYVESESMTEVDTYGVIQPFTSRQLMIRPEGERSWSWFMLHTKVDIHAANDDVIIIEGVQYRVMQQFDYIRNGFYEYDVIEDWTNSGPTVTP